MCVPRSNPCQERVRRQTNILRPARRECQDTGHGRQQVSDRLVVCEFERAVCSCRKSEEDFEEVHSRLRRGDIIGVTGCPGQ